MAPTTARLSGGPHNGERITQPAPDPFPERLWSIGFDDGAAYARQAVEVDAETGDDVLVMQYDPDGSLTRALMAADGVDPDTPPRPPPGTA